ncbi:probable ATP-dependent RNA helicase pitchoune [Trichogramma pretiosum]|uniref:probable ATP-dependent RNA helicase pitchoune n=1 Tax=Trichogramma pretiosum TaxID=7493 RepID=UPI0006C95321|nr:probable ATP-dependent RNA helicase pitchoune [Trichogramma pretiosum]
MVFFSSCRSVMFHHVFFNIFSLPNMSIHGRQAQTKRTKTFYDFCSASSGTLLCTDIAARDLDIPNVDCIIQYDPPSDTKEYIHRVGRTTRGVGSCGNALLILRPKVLEFLKYLEKAKVPVTELELKNTVKAQLQIEKLMSKKFWLRDSAKDAYESYLRAYNSHNLKDVFNVNTLNLAEVVKSIGFLAPPTNFPLITRSNCGNTSRSRKERVYEYSKDPPNAPRRYQRANKFRKF